jgi:predicted nucleic acid-binding protein
MRAYVDSDILIWHLRGEAKAKRFLKDLARNRDYELWTGAMQRAEILFFARPGEEDLTEDLMARFDTAPVDAVIVESAASLYRKWHPGHGIDMPDALLAATLLETGGVLFTKNTKHYPMPELSARQAW